MATKYEYAVMESGTADYLQAALNQLASDGYRVVAVTPEVTIDGPEAIIAGSVILEREQVKPRGTSAEPISPNA